MRITIKGADFSSVSIGRILQRTVIDKDTQDDYLLNPVLDNAWGAATQTNNNGTTVYIGSNAESLVESDGNKNRFVTQFFELPAGSTIHVYNGTRVASTPDVVAFDGTKQLLPNKCIWFAEDAVENIATVPEGVSFIKVQLPSFSENTRVVLEYV